MEGNKISANEGFKDYGEAFREIFRTLEEKFSDFANSFLDELKSGNIFSPEELSPKERLFRLLLFIEKRIIIFPKLVSKMFRYHNELNKHLQSKIEDVVFQYGFDDGEELSLNLNALFREKDRLGGIYGSKEIFYKTIEEAGLLKEYEQYKEQKEGELRDERKDTLLDWNYRSS